VTVTLTVHPLLLPATYVRAAAGRSCGSLIRCDQANSVQSSSGTGETHPQAAYPACLPEGDKIYSIAPSKTGAQSGRILFAPPSMLRLLYGASSLDVAHAIVTVHTELYCTRRRMHLSRTGKGLVQLGLWGHGSTWLLTLVVNSTFFHLQGCNFD
jgi:hypothetical protein